MVKLKGKFAQGFHSLYIVDLPWVVLWAVIFREKHMNTNRTDELGKWCLLNLTVA